MCTFSYGHLFLVSIFYQPTSEKNQVHSGDLTNCKQTWQLIKFYLIENMKGDRGNWLAQLKFPFLSILWLFLKKVSLPNLNEMEMYGEQYGEYAYWC